MSRFTRAARRSTWLTVDVLGPSGGGAVLRRSEHASVMRLRQRPAPQDRCSLMIGARDLAGSRGLSRIRFSKLSLCVFL